jgi:hypothetical protein
MYTPSEGFLVSVESLKFTLKRAPRHALGLCGADLPTPHPQRLDPVFRHGA